jgi:hypothetical protein
MKIQATNTGRLVLPNGDVYEGNFADGMKVKSIIF